MAEVQQLLDEVDISDLGVLTLVRNDEDGTVVTSPYFDYDTATDATTIDDPALQTGVDQELFAEMKSVVDFSTQWDPQEATMAFQSAIFETNENYITLYPIPPIPETYDPNYVPEFYAIFTFSKLEGITMINQQLNEEVDQQVWDIIQLVIIIGVSGMFIVLILILATASWFVRPLKWMNRVGEKMLGNFGEVSADESGIDLLKDDKQLCTPKTELNSLLEEFKKMVSRFSGEGAAKRMHMNDTERFNVFEFSQEYSNLYKSRQDEDFEFKYPNTVSNISTRNTVEYCYHGPNTRDYDLISEYSVSEPTDITKQNVYKSPFFHWLSGLMVTPLLIATIIISAVVLTQISKELPTLTDTIEEEYVSIRDSFRTSATGLLAIQVSSVMSKAARDTHMLTRFANWLYFGGMGISDSFTDAMEGAEECKTYQDPMECDWRKNLPCDCAWNDFFTREKDVACTPFSPGESRALQIPYFEAQNQDTDERGSRNSTSYPDVANFPNTTSWWDNIEALPQVDSADTVYDSTYDRVKVLSALSTVLIPLYNYDKSDNKPLAAYIGFEADGMMAGYQYVVLDRLLQFDFSITHSFILFCNRGCEYGFVGYSFWQSTEANGAAKLRPELCPLGKYGFDSRCRGWYDTGKKRAFAGNGTLHITAPYVFAGGEKITGQSTSSPVMQGAKHIGQTIIGTLSNLVIFLGVGVMIPYINFLLDFIPGSSYRSLYEVTNKLEGGAFPLLITPDSDGKLEA